MTPRPILVGVQEIIDEFGISRSTLYRYIRKGTFPRPVAELRSGQVWERRDIVKRLGRPQN